MSLSWRKSIGARFSLITLVLVFSISSVFFAVESFLSYRTEVARLDRDLLQIRQSHIPSLISSLWLTDHALLQQQIDAIARFQYVGRVEIVDDAGKILHAGGDGSPSLQVFSETLNYARRGVRTEIGELRLFIDRRRLRNDAILKQTISLVGKLFVMLVVTLSIALLFRKQVAGPLERLAEDLQDEGLAALDSPIQLHRKADHPDELASLARAVNRMRLALHSHLKEKELLVAEVHHRIKNDMAFVKALLYLQAEQSGTPEVSTALGEASQRVSVMTRIYERLYGDGNFLEVALRPLARQVIEDLEALSDLPSDTITLEVDDLRVPTKLSVTVGIILNELVTNALKYAFDEKGLRHIAVRIGLDAEAAVVDMVVADVGAGMPADVISGKRRGYGLTIVNALAEQHRGTLELRNEGGAVVVVRLPLG